MAVAKPGKKARAERNARARSARTWILVATVILLLGIALSVTDDESFGPWLTLLGLVGAIVALHRYGRLGADGPRDLLAPPPKS